MIGVEMRRSEVKTLIELRALAGCKMNQEFKYRFIPLFQLTFDIRLIKKTLFYRQWFEFGRQRKTFRNDVEMNDAVALNKLQICGREMAPRSKARTTKVTKLEVNIGPRSNHLDRNARSTAHIVIFYDQMITPCMETNEQPRGSAPLAR